MAYGDMRDQMHPKVAATVPKTPEATAILEGQHIKSLTFGGLVTKLVENGAVDAGNGMDGIRSDVSNMLGFDETEFSERLAGTRLIHDSEAHGWIQEFCRKSEAELIEAKRQEALSHFTDYVFSHVEDPHLEILQSMVDEQRRRVQTLEEEVSKLEAKDNIGAFPVKASLERGAKPKLKDLEAARYAIPLTEMVDVLKGDSFITEHGKEFTKEFAQDLGDYLSRVKILPEDWWLSDQFSDEESYMEEEELRRFQSIWLTEREILLLAKSYANAFYSYSNLKAPGTEERDNLPNPLAEVLLITDEEKEAFFIAFPIASGSRPR